MREIFSKVKIINYEDVGLYAKGVIKKEEIRVIEEEGKIDTGSTHLVIPRRIFEKLGLRKIDEIEVIYANGKKEKKTVASVVVVEIKGRKAYTTPIVEENDKILIGNPILEEMDFYIDAVTGEIKPRHPEAKGPVAYIEQMKEISTGGKNG